MTVLGVVLSPGAWIALLSALAAAGMTAAIILLRDYLRLERRALTLQAENNRLRGEIRLILAPRHKEAWTHARGGVNDGRRTTEGDGPATTFAPGVRPEPSAPCSTSGFARHCDLTIGGAGPRS
jgi:hypothetical protein